MSSHSRLNCKSHLTPTLTLITDQSTSKGGVNIKIHSSSCDLQVSKSCLYKYQPSSGQSSSLLMKTSCLRLKLVELNFFASFTTDDQSIFYVSGFLVWDARCATYALISKIAHNICIYACLKSSKLQHNHASLHRSLQMIAHKISESCINSQTLWDFKSAYISQLAWPSG